VAKDPAAVTNLKSHKLEEKVDSKAAELNIRMELEVDTDVVIAS